MKQHLKQTGFAIILILVSLTPLAARADDGPEWTGTLTSRPAGVTGTWVIGGLSFEANAGTLIEEEHGPLNTGACAEVKYYTSGGTNIATKIESQESYKCNGGGGGGGPSLKVYATVNSFPSGLIGDWVIGGVTYTADGNTRFEQKHGSFRVGACVEVKYVSGSNQALEIETESAYKCSGSGGGGGGVPHSQVYGALDSFPPGLIGDWVVAGVTYTADANTRFEQEHGPFFQGGCVEVKYQSGTNVAVEISTEEPYKCGGTGSVESKFYGLIDAIPANPQNGTWTIGGGVFVSTPATQLKQEHGAFANGACAEVEYYDDTSGGHIATKIETQEPYKCNTSTYTNQIYGTISSFPVGLYGSWVIGNETYNASAATKFEQEHGAFAAGACVKVKYYVQNGVNHATKIETESSSHCGGSGPPSLPADSKVYATIDSFPASPYIGTWVIGGVSYEATAATKFEQEHGLFAAGACVKAKYTAANGVNTLSEVETEEAYKCQQAGGGGPEFKSYGVIEALPPLFSSGILTGTWQISGVSYEADGSTRFEQEHGFFTLGAYVEVKYTRSGGINTALSIETHVAPSAGLNMLVGTLQSHDSNDDWTDWVVDGVTYKADPAIEVGASGQMPVAGEPVLLSTYRGLDGSAYVTSAALAQQVFLPAIFQ
ncbi:MAG: DUF5666 domain-containing protein [Anaerolineae bacterium]